MTETLTVPETSIVIRAFNEEKHLGKLLESIRAQRYQDAEIILVDSGSTDLTRQIAEAHCDRVIQIASRDFTYGYSLNVGCQAGRGKYIVIVSAHTAPVHDDWLGNLVANFADKEVAMVCGRQLGAPESKLGEVRDLARTFGDKRLVLEPPVYFANNANSAVRRDLWEKHPFDETLPGLEDVAWAKHWMEAGYQVVYDPTAPVYHIHEESWRQVKLRYYREAMAARHIGIKNRGDIPGELLREGWHLVADLARVAVAPKLWRRAGEVVLFRTNKALGTAAGLRRAEPQPDTELREEMMFNRRGRAVVIEGPRRAALRQVEVPAVKPGDVLIKVAYVGLCATDLEIYNGTLGYYRDGRAKYPIIPGHEFSGQVTAVGSQVQHIAEGDHVVVETVQGCGDCDRCKAGNRVGCAFRTEVGVFGLSGAYADYTVVPGAYVHRLPPGLDFRLGALCEPLSVVLKGLRRLGDALADQRPVAVVGAGPIGHLSTRVLRHRGHAVTVFDKDETRLSYLADVTADLHADLDGLDAFSVVVEATGNGEALDAVLRGSAPGATILMLGLPYAKSESGMEQVVANDKTLVGSVGAGPDDLEEAISLAGRLKLDGFLEVTYPLESFEQAWDAVRRRSHLKVLLEVDPLLARMAVERGSESAMRPRVD